MVSSSKKRRSARISGAPENITQEMITTPETTVKPIPTKKSSSQIAQLKIVSSGDESERPKKEDNDQTNNEDAEFTQWMATSETDDSENVPSASIVQKVTEILEAEEKHFQRIKVCVR